jgi:hypothetical protein
MSKVVIIPEKELEERIKELEERKKTAATTNLSNLYSLTLNVYKDIMASCDRVDCVDSWENVPGINDPVEMKNLRPKGVIILKNTEDDTTN